MPGLRQHKYRKTDVRDQFPDRPTRSKAPGPRRYVLLREITLGRRMRGTGVLLRQGRGIKNGNDQLRVHAAARPDKGYIMEPMILIATEKQDRFSPLADGLKNQIDADIHWAESGNDALTAAKTLSPLMVIIDETLPDMSGMDFARELLKLNALINTALVSGLSPEDFHEASEGLGVLVQLPVSPGEENAEDIVSGLKSVFALPPDP